jgi:hypothetical protein
MPIHPASPGFPENHKINGEQLPGGFLPSNATKLIMGSFPPPSIFGNQMALDSFFYYYSPKNHFWNRIESFVPYPPGFRWKWVAGANENSLKNTQRKRALCAEMGWAFMDIVYSAEFLNPVNFDDNNLIDRVFVTDNGFLLNSLEHIISITQILCTYQGVKTWLINELERLGCEIDHNPNHMSADGHEYSFTYNNRLIQIILLYPATRSRHPGPLKNAQYQHFLDLSP